MGISTAGGVTLSIGSSIETTNPAPTLSDYEADSYVEVGEVEDAGQYGDESATITFTALQDGRVQKLKGPRDAGTQAVVAGTVPNDEGQEAMEAAQATSFNFNFRVVRNDQLTLSGTPSIDYYSGRVMSQRLNVGNVMNVLKTTFNIGINTAIQTVPAT
jgi:hypothetical protein